jgi:hypothetical protein
LVFVWAKSQKTLMKYKSLTGYVKLGTLPGKFIYLVICIPLFRLCISANENEIAILSIKNGNDNIRIEDNCLEEELLIILMSRQVR